QNATCRRGRGTCSRRSSAGLPGLAAAGARLGVPAVPALAAVLAVMARVAVAAAPLGVGLAAVLDTVGGEADVGLDAHRLVGAVMTPPGGPRWRRHGCRRGRSRRAGSRRSAGTTANRRCGGGCSRGCAPRRAGPRSRRDPPQGG